MLCAAATNKGAAAITYKWGTGHTRYRVAETLTEHYGCHRYKRKVFAFYPVTAWHITLASYSLFRPCLTYAMQCCTNVMIWFR